MDFYDRIAAAFDARKVNRAQVGRETGISGQAVTLKLQRKSAVTPHEIEVYARYAGLTVSEALGENAVVLEKPDEQELVELYRRMGPDARRAFFGVGREMAPASDQEPDPQTPG